MGVGYAGLVFNITGMFPLEDLPLSLIYVLRNVPNPRFGRTVTGITLRVVDAASNILFSKIMNNQTFQPRTMACTGVATDFTTVNNFPSTASIKIFPVTNPRDSPLTLITF